MQLNRYSKTVRIFSFATATLLATASLQGQSFVNTAFGNGADTTLTNDSQHGPTVVRSGLGSVEVRNFSGSRIRMGLIRFDVSEYIAESLTGATLTLTFTGAPNTRDFLVYGLTDQTLDNWEEATTSYSNAPGILPADLGAYQIDTNVWSQLGTFTISAGAGTKSSETSSLNLDNFLTSNTNGLVSFLLISNATTNIEYYFDSKENASGNAPLLDLPNATAIPEPSTYAMLFGVGALAGVILVRRRRSTVS